MEALVIRSRQHPSDAAQPCGDVPAEAVEVKDTGSGYGGYNYYSYGAQADTKKLVHRR